jgi:hypothetical protein
MIQLSANKDNNTKHTTMTTTTMTTTRRQTPTTHRPRQRTRQWVHGGNVTLQRELGGFPHFPSSRPRVQQRVAMARAMPTRQGVACPFARSWLARG